MFESFVSWDMLITFSTFVASVFMLVEFTKELPLIKLIRTKYYSAIIAFILLVIVNLHGGTFEYWDIVLYVLSACSISFTSNGISDFNDSVLKGTKDIKVKTEIDTNTND